MDTFRGHAGLVLLSPPEPRLTAGYRDLARTADALAGPFSATLRCRPGCSSCCATFSVLPLEAAIIAAVLRGDGIAPDVSRSGARQCALLSDDRCSIYPYRPLLCRTQGLPLAYVDEAAERIEVSACPLNFAPEYEFDPDELVFLDPINARLARLNLSYCLNRGLDPTGRIAVETLAAAAANG